MKDHYIQAVLELMKEGKSSDEILAGLTKVLIARGHESLFGAVLRGVLRVAEAESDRTGTVVTVARSADATAQVGAIKAVLETMGANEDYVVKEDDSLIGGFTAEVANTVYDASHKKALIKLYREVTK